MTDQNATRLPANMAGAYALIDSWRIRAEAAEALVRQMRGEVDELGIQYHAAQERLRLAGAVIEADGVVMADVVIAAGEGYEDGYRQIFKGGGYEAVKRATAARAAWDAVPGDAKVVHVHAVNMSTERVQIGAENEQVQCAPFDEAGTMNPDPVCQCDEYNRSRGHSESCPYAIPRI